MKIIETGGITILIDSKQFESLKNLRAGQIKNPHFCGKTELQNTITKVKSSLYPDKELYLAEAWGDIRVKAFECITSVDAKPQSGHRTYFEQADEAVLYHNVMRTVLEHGLSIVDSIQNTSTTTKEKEMKKERMTLIENVEILSNVSQKTLGYTIFFRGNQHTITPSELTQLSAPDFVRNIIGDFQPIKGATLTTYRTALPIVYFEIDKYSSFAIDLPQTDVSEKYPVTKDLPLWVESFNKFLDEIDALNIENVEVPTFKNIVLV